MTYYHAPRKRKKKGSGKRTKTIITIFTALIMITSIMGFLFGGSNTGGELMYKNIRFVQQKTQWTAKIDGNQVAFYTNPLEAEGIDMNSEGVRKLQEANVVYLTFDPEIADIAYIDLLRFELAEELPAYFDIMVVPAVARANSSYALPVIDCRNATNSVPVLYFNDGKTTKTSYYSDCLLIEAPSAQIMLRQKDRLLYGLFGLIE